MENELRIHSTWDNRKTAFDMYSYQKVPEAFRVQKISNDIAGIFTEAADLPTHLRIWPHTWYLVNSVVTESTQNIVDVRHSFSWDSNYKDETEASIQFRQLFIDNDEGSILIWISPPGGKNNYVEGRFNVGYIYVDQGIKTMQCYGIPITVSENDCFSLASNLMALAEIETPETIDVVRKRSFILKQSSDYSNPWLYLSSITPQYLGLSWESIYRKMPELRRATSVEDAGPISEKAAYLLSVASTQQQYLMIGALAEMEMIARGYTVLTKPCDLPWNTSELSRTRSWNTISDIFGFRRTSLEKWEYVVGDCRCCPEKNVEVGPCRICKICEQSPINILKWTTYSEN